jgi:hypothetical protein
LALGRWVGQSGRTTVHLGPLRRPVGCHGPSDVEKFPDDAAELMPTGTPHMARREGHRGSARTWRALHLPRDGRRQTLGHRRPDTPAAQTTKRGPAMRNTSTSRCPSCGGERPHAIADGIFEPGSACPHCGHVEPTTKATSHRPRCRLQSPTPPAAATDAASHTADRRPSVSARAPTGAIRTTSRDNGGKSRAW